MKSFIFFLIISSFLFSKSDYLIFGSGIHNILREKHRTAEFLLEYKTKYNFKKIHPFLGVMTTLRSAFYGCFGLSFDLVLKKRFLISPSLAAGYYRKGGDKDLGYPLEFRSCFSLGYQFSNLSRLKVGFYHMSNASLGRHNPGTEALIFCYSLPLKRYFK